MLKCPMGLLFYLLFICFYLFIFFAIIVVRLGERRTLDFKPKPILFKSGAPSSFISLHGARSVAHKTLATLHKTIHSTFLAIRPQKYGTLKLLLTQDHMELYISKATPTVFIRSEPSFLINEAVINEYKIMNVLSMCQKLKILWAFEILTPKSMRKS